MRNLVAAGVVTVGASAALSLIAKAAIITTLALIAGWLARRRRAAVRHLIYVAAFVALALLPVATVVIPPVSVPVRLAPVAAMQDVPLVHGTGRIAEASSVVTEPPAESRDKIRAWPAISTSALLTVVWLIGVISCLVPVAIGLWQIHVIRRLGLPWREAQVMADDLAHQAGFSKPVDVMVHEALAGPVTCGVVSVAILFPPDARTWCDVDVRRALTHELEHVRRRDWITLCVARITCAMYWFLPLVWIVNRQLLVNAERACDDAVLRESQAFLYADQLVTLAERTLARADHPLLAMAGRGDLSTRVRAVLDVGQQRGPAGVGARIGVAIAATASIALLAPLRTVVDARAQTPITARRPQFEVASIKPFVGDGIMHVRPLPGRLTANGTLQILMQQAYGVQAFQIAGGPGWMTSARYEVDARAGAPTDRGQLLLMLQSLLEDRFHLKTHRETKELPVFTLVSNRSGVTMPAPKDGACAESDADAALEWSGGRMPVPGELPPAKSRCGSAVVAITRFPPQALLSGGKIAMPELARALSLVLGRSVIDKTGIAGLFNVQLEFLPDETTPGVPPPPPGLPITGATLPAALRQQLGLRLESGRGPVDVIVVDQAVQPSAN